jgi:hypothetical protein
MPATCYWLPPWSFCQACIDDLLLSCYCCTGAKAHSSTPLPLTCLPACLPACSWERFTLDGSPSLLPPPDAAPGDSPVRHLLDLTAADTGFTARINLLPGVAGFSLSAKGIFFGGYGGYGGCGG